MTCFNLTKFHLLSYLKLLSFIMQISEEYSTHLYIASDESSLKSILQWLKHIYYWYIGNLEWFEYKIIDTKCFVHFSIASRICHILGSVQHHLTNSVG